MHLFIDIIRNSILITGLVVVMMMMIESLNIESKGLIFSGLKKTKIGQVVFGALLGSIPGCMGGFATVSLYTHRMLSFGALTAMMIASSGDEAFIMLAMIPDKALLIFAILFVIAVAVGVATDLIYTRIHKRKCHLPDHSECRTESNCHEGYAIHELPAESCNEDKTSHTEIHRKKSRHYGWKRMTMFIGLAIFIAALASGQLGHDHSAHDSHTECIHTGHCHEANIQHDHATCHHKDSERSPRINLLNEDWMNILFAGLSILMLLVLLLGSDHFIEEHLWNHIVKKHLLTIFSWTFGVLLIVGIGLQYISIDKWISDNTILMIILATLLGIIPESGPHMIFVTLYATGIVPFPVLLASCISQDGHASLPLIAESRKSFLWAKVINCVIALTAGFTAMLI